MTGTNMRIELQRFKTKMVNLNPEGKQNKKTKEVDQCCETGDFLNDSNYVR